ncbi:MAG: selenide, water dikinase SelD, partial [Clostridia bacterium]|nr:selenide, water dikinase SelD [Clostridia bacterium]
MGPGTLTEILASIPQVEDPRLLVSGATMDDAGVYLLSEELALIQTVDFFTPMVDDPYLFGQVAAANALSDVYAMGGVPLTALNIAAFPINNMDPGILREILLGGADKVREAGALLVGGHTVEDPEPKYGLAVTGTVHPQKVLTNQGARPGDVLVLTKPLGIGIICTAIKGDLADSRAVDQAVRSMVALNQKAMEVVQEIGVHACTD